MSVKDCRACLFAEHLMQRDEESSKMLFCGVGFASFVILMVALLGFIGLVSDQILVSDAKSFRALSGIMGGIALAFSVGGLIVRPWGLHPVIHRDEFRRIHLHIPVEEVFPTLRWKTSKTTSMELPVGGQFAIFRFARVGPQVCHVTRDRLVQRGGLAWTVSGWGWRKNLSVKDTLGSEVSGSSCEILGLIDSQQTVSDGYEDLMQFARFVENVVAVVESLKASKSMIRSPLAQGVRERLEAALETVGVDRIASFRQMSAEESPGEQSATAGVSDS